MKPRALQQRFLKTTQIESQRRIRAQLNVYDKVFGNSIWDVSMVPNYTFRKFQITFRYMIIKWIPFSIKLQAELFQKKVQKECSTVNIFQHTFFSEHRSVTFTSYKRLYESNFQDLKVTLKCSHCMLISRTPRRVQFASWHHLDFSTFFLNPFSTNVLLLYPLKTFTNLRVDKRLKNNVL